jgi:citrate synthase
MDFELLKNAELSILAIGNHPLILQSILDYDFLVGKTSPSLKAIIQSTENRKFQKFFFGSEEVLIPIFENIPICKQNFSEIDLFINLNSGRRCYQTTLDFFGNYPDALGGHLFAEDVPEKHAIDLYKRFGEKKIVAGPSGVGILIPGFLKLGAIGGTDINQIIQNKLWQKGNTAIVSASGGMANELVTILSQNNKNISIAFTVGGDRFPANTIKDIFLKLEADSATKYVAYYGELGGDDEYEVIELIKTKQFTKKLICYIAGVVEESFDKPTQFGHAKAISQNKDESARSKRNALKEANAIVAESFSEFTNFLKTEIVQESISEIENMEDKISKIKNRKESLFTSKISSEENKIYKFVGKDLENWNKNESLSKMIISGLLGHLPKSEITSEFMEIALKTFLDHGPQVSGAVNTMISARAGKDLVSSVASGILTIGPRFGGATNDAAQNWFKGVSENIKPAAFVEEFSKNKKPILGIGHLKYKIGNEDPRVKQIKEFSKKLENHKYLDFALSIESITSLKKSNLILNVDGAIAALMLDILETCENYSKEKIKELIDIEFFNALFLVARTIGFTSHYLDQKRNDEGLFRLPDYLVKLSDN